VGQLITENLFQRILVEPIQRGARELFVVTGYASPAMVTRHFQYAVETLGTRISLDLHIGMAGKDGVRRTDLLGYRSIPRQSREQEFNCTFSTRGRSNHSKLFVWCSNSGPVEAFLGSSNYTQVGFGLSASDKFHAETCTNVDPDEAFSYVLNAAKGSIGYLDLDIATHIDLTEDQRPESSGASEENDQSTQIDFVFLPLVQSRGQNAGRVHDAGGLNWGQRDGREPNQAYIPVPSDVARSDLFPEKGVHFQITTDDGQAFICTIAQSGDKAIETPSDNSILGKYFRNRLGVSLGTYVTDADLNRFGATAIKISKINHDSYRLDFAPGMFYGQDVS
jgi:hypothetical protein